LKFELFRRGKAQKTRTSIFVASCGAVLGSEPDLSTLHAVNIESRWFSRHDSFPDSEVRVAGKRVEAALGNDGDGTSTHGATSVAAKGQALDAADEA
jgi:hypothetical protein